MTDRVIYTTVLTHINTITVSPVVHDLLIVLSEDWPREHDIQLDSDFILNFWLLVSTVECKY